MGHTETLVFVGGYAPPDVPGIQAFTLDQSTGEIGPRGAFPGVQNPSFLAAHPGGRFLYAVSETAQARDGICGAIHAFRIERGGTGVNLHPLGERASGGDDPCHLCLDSTGRWLVASNYGTGSVAVLPILPDGRLGDTAGYVRHAGAGPNAARQEGPHTHSTVFSPDGRFLIVADLGTDQIVVYRFDAGLLVPHDAVSANPGAGPRHLAFHPDGGDLFVVNELDSTLSHYRYGAHAGSLRAVQTLSTLPVAVENTAADVHVAADGHHIYVSNRGHDSLAVFAFGPPRDLRRAAVRPCGGSWPRGFALAPGGRFVLVANRHSDEITLLPLLDGGADLGGPVSRLGVREPACVTFV